MCERLVFLIGKAKTRCFVNDARGAYDVLKEAMDLIPVEPLDLTEEEKQSHHEGTKSTKKGVRREKDRL